jgi:hypothetical protein
MRFWRSGAGLRTTQAMSARIPHGGQAGGEPEMSEGTAGPPRKVSLAAQASTDATPRLSIGSWMPLAERSREDYGIAPRDRHPRQPGLAGDVGGHGERQLGGGIGPDMKWRNRASPLDPRTTRRMRRAPMPALELLLAAPGRRALWPLPPVAFGLVPERARGTRAMCRRLPCPWRSARTSAGRSRRPLGGVRRRRGHDGPAARPRRTGVFPREGPSRRVAFDAGVHRSGGGDGDSARPQ